MIYSLSYRIIWMMLFVIPSCVFSVVDEHHKHCSAPITCGDQTNLFYPFWITGKEECGHPEFKLECYERVAEVSISSVKFRILGADRASRVIRLARSDYFNGSCPQNPVDVQFSKSVLQLDPGTKPLTIYYGCRDFSSSTYFGELDCDDEKSYYVTRNLSSPLFPSGLLNDFKGLCKGNVSIPTSEPELNTLEISQNQDDLKKALDEGFKLRPNGECLQCMDSGGVCGYNLKSSGFICYCEDKPHSHTCGSRNKLKISCLHDLNKNHHYSFPSPNLSPPTKLLIRL